MRKLLLVFLIPALCMFITSNAQGAGSTTSTLWISTLANVVCAVVTPPLNFGDYTGDEILINSNFSVQCSLQTPYTISFDGGLNGSDGTGRKMEQIGVGGNFLNYRLWCPRRPDEPPGQDCGDGIIYGPTISEEGTGTAQIYNIMGVLIGGQYVPLDFYQDQVTVTVSY